MAIRVERDGIANAPAETAEESEIDIIGAELRSYVVAELVSYRRDGIETDAEIADRIIGTVVSRALSLRNGSRLGYELLLQALPNV